MPTATKELRNKMGELFGHGLDYDFVDDWPPTEYLLNRGWTEKGGVWTQPKDRTVTPEEWDCMNFLFQEWDHALAH